MAAKGRQRVVCQSRCHRCQMSMTEQLQGSSDCVLLCPQLTLTPLQEKRKRDTGKANSAKDHVQEEKRIARNYGVCVKLAGCFMGYPSWVRLAGVPLLSAWLQVLGL